MAVYKGNSYITTAAREQAVMLKPNQKVINDTGGFVQPFQKYLESLTSAPNPESGITLGTSPATFQATSNGSVLVSGGTVSAISLTRNGTYNLGVTSGYIPLSVNDVLTVTYSAAPILTWFPR